MSVDVSPDGRELAFDLLGEIYAVSIEGGTARRVTPSNLGVHSNPQFAPDGRHISFVSDLSGDDQIWIIDRVGGEPRRVTTFGHASGSSTELLSSATWDSNGNNLFMAVMAGNERKLVEVNHNTGEVQEVSVGPNCRPSNSGAAMAHGRLFVACYARAATGSATTRGTIREAVIGVSETIDTLTDGSPVVVRVSADGRWLIYLTRIQAETAEERFVLWRQRRDQSDQASSLGQIEMSLGRGDIDVPAFGITPDSRSVVISSAGKLLRIEIESGARTEIPFRVDVVRSLARQTLRSRALGDGSLRVRHLLEPRASNDGSFVVFSAAGKIWRADRDGRVWRLTGRNLSDPIVEFSPAISPDDRWIAFATWSVREGGRIWRLPASGGEPLMIAPESADQHRAFGSIRWSPDGQRLAYLTSRVVYPEVQSPREGGVEPQVRFDQLVVGWTDLATHRTGSASVPALQTTDNTFGILIQDLSFSQNGDQLYIWSLPDYRRGYWPPQHYALYLVNLAGDRAGSVQTRLSVWAFALRGELSPDGRWLALEQDGNISLVDASSIRPDQLVTIGDYRGVASPNVQQIRPPVIAVTTLGGFAPKWSSDGQWLTWNRGAQVFRRRTSELVTDLQVAPEPAFSPNIVLERATPQGSLLLRGARVIPVAGTPIDRADLLIVGRRIARIGAVGSFPVPAQTRIVSVEGRTIVPGYIGLQDGNYQASSLTPFLNQTYRAGLSHGMTTSWTPGQVSQQGLAAIEAREVGALVATRQITPGCDTTKATQRRISSIGDARAIMQICAIDPDAYPEAYTPLSRRQRQLLASAASDLNLSISTEGGNYRRRLSELIDGFALLEHPKGMGRFREDLRELWIRSGSAWHANAYAQDLNWIGQNVRDLLRAGAPVGTSGECTDEECRRFGPAGAAVRMAESTPGLTNFEALELLTVGPARALGVSEEVGTIEVGKIADLVVLRGNPMENVRALLSVEQVIQDGILYDASELAPHSASRAR